MSAASAERLVLAQTQGLKRFDGDLCIHGCGTTRFTSNLRCVDCAMRRKRELPRKKYPSPPRTDERRVREREMDLARRRRKGMMPKPPAISKEERLARKRAHNSRPDIKARRAAKVMEKYYADPSFRLAKRMSRAVRRSLKSKEAKRGRSWEDLVGYSVKELRAHLERQFLKKMGWHNIDKWQVDHILPVASFGPMVPGDDAFLACWALSNLRPLWKPDNHQKSAKRLHLI